MDLKKPLSFDEQITHLKEHGMLISNEASARSLLCQTNYYRLSGYSYQFRREDDPEKYIPGTSFETVAKLYSFDEEMRDVLKIYIEIAEVYYRTQIAHGFVMAKCIDPPHDQHYLETNYYNKDGFNKIIQDIEKQKVYYKDSLVVKHHQNKYGGRLPLWVMVEMISFSNLSKLYNCMYITEQDAIAGSIGTGKETLKNHLHCLSVLRNRCAHAGRLYNTTWKPSAKYSSKFLRAHPEFKNDTFFAYVGVLVKRLPASAQRSALVSRICSLLETYKDAVDLQLIGFPEDYEQILNNFV